MKFVTSPALPLVVLVLIAFVGMAGLIESLQQPYLLTCLSGLMVLGFAGIGLGELRGKFSGAGLASAGEATKSLEAKAPQFDRELGVVLKRLQVHIEANGRYSDQLAQADRKLLSIDHSENVSAIIRILVEANEKMRRETGELTASLEKSRSQVESLSFRLAEAQEIGMRDSLTSLGNRRSFDVNLIREIDEARAKRTDMCLVMGDLDHFKKVNDNFGHVFGDRVLKHFADLLTKNIKGRDTAARFGGEEFAIILPQTTIASAALLVEQIRSRLEAQQWMNAKSGQLFSKITASFGIVRLNSGDDAEGLLKRADAMLYEAKRAGRNRIASEAAAA
jgi:diguanylate cyclase